MMEYGESFVFLGALSPGDLIRAKTQGIDGPGRMDFLILERGEKPKALFCRANEDGMAISDPEEMILRGSIFETGKESAVDRVFLNGGMLLYSDVGDPREERWILGPMVESFEVYAHDRVIIDNV